MPVVYSKNPDIVFRKIADECILVPIRKSVADLESIYALNETASRAWELIDGKMDIDEIQQRIVEEFDVSPQAAGQDLRQLFQKLKDTGSIEENQ
jgi:hypothetical protein